MEQGTGNTVGLTLRGAHVNFQGQWFSPPLQCQLPAHILNIADALSVLEEREQTSKQKEKRVIHR